MNFFHKKSTLDYFLFVMTTKNNLKIRYAFLISILKQNYMINFLYFFELLNRNLSKFFN